MRGKPKKHDATQAANGITPAYAGKTTVSHTRRWGTRDHPRVCGENWFFAALAAPL